MAEYLIDFSETERIVFLIDLHPILHLPDPSPYIAAVLSAAGTLLRFPLLSSSLFAFKLFFSSLSPLLSSSKLHPLLGASAASVSFHHPSQTLASLARALHSLSPLFRTSTDSAVPTSPGPKAVLAASSLLQLVHDYAWDNPVRDSLGKVCDFPVLRRNLVVLFSPIPNSLKCLSEYMNVDVDDGLLMNVDKFSMKFCEFFGHVSGVFVNRDIHCCWVDVKYALGCEDDEVVAFDESAVKLGNFENAIRKLEWGLCSTASIVLGSAIVPFGLIYPKIVTNPRLLDCNDCCKMYRAQLSLEILDVSGKPLECKCCDLDLINLKMMSKHRYDDILHTKEVVNSEISTSRSQKSFWGQFGDGVTKFQVRAVRRYDSCIKLEGCLYDVLLARGYPAKLRNEVNKRTSEFFVDRLLEMLSTESCEFFQRKAVPIWQILLSFLYREDCWAMVSLSNGNGNSFTGILKPFTVHSALISIMDKEILPQNLTNCLGGQNLTQFPKKRDEVGIPNVDKNHSEEFINSQCGTSSLKKRAALRNIKSKKIEKQFQLHKDLSWKSFCKKASEHLGMVLEEFYFAKGCNSSKKLKFLKCWMKQVKKSSCSYLETPDESQPQAVNSKEIEDRLSRLQQESEQPVSLSASTGEDSLNESSRILEGADPLPHFVTSEAFFSSLSGKIQDGLQSEQVDLWALAERLVNSSTHLLYQKYGMNVDSENQTPVTESDNTCDQIVAEVTKLLLLEPKDLAAKHKASNSGSPILASEIIVREYELQILFRMEILRSVTGGSTHESTKLKFVKQICLLLEKIQCHLEGGFFGGTSLDKYVDRAINSRYSKTLGDVVNRIYRKMDLLLFNNEDDSPNPLLNSEDSNQSWREKPEREEKGENWSMDEHCPAEDECPQPLENASGKSQSFKDDEHSRKLLEAQVRRERARRFASFTSWKPDLQRVWAPKQPMAMRAKLDPVQKLLKKKDRRRESYDTVCETPMTGKKRSCRRGNGACFDEHEKSGINSCASVSKALFQDEC